jgi:hypothetical protein
MAKLIFVDFRKQKTNDPGVTKSQYKSQQSQK